MLSPERDTANNPPSTQGSKLKLTSRLKKLLLSGDLDLARLQAEVATMPQDKLTEREQSIYKAISHYLKNDINKSVGEMCRAIALNPSDLDVPLSIYFIDGKRQAVYQLLASLFESSLQVRQEILVLEAVLKIAFMHINKTEASSIISTRNLSAYTAKVQMKSRHRKRLLDFFEEIVVKHAITRKEKPSPPSTPRNSPYECHTSPLEILYSSTNRIGIYIRYNDGHSDPQLNSIELARPELYNSIRINKAIVEEQNDCGLRSALVCIDRYTSGNMYHSGLIHLAIALRYKHEVGSDTLFVFSENTWQWSKQLIKEAMKGCNYTFSLKPNRRNVISSPIIYRHFNEFWSRSFGSNHSLRCTVFNEILAAGSRLASLSTKSLDSGERVFITRALGTSRYPEKLDELHEWLISIGFRIVDFSEFSPAEQLSVVKNSRILSGLHGAALANLIAARNNTLVVELAPSFQKRDCYRRLFANRLEYIYCECIDSTDFIRGMPLKEASLELNLDLAKSAFMRALQHDEYPARFH